jgi:hypothetical protein
MPNVVRTAGLAIAATLLFAVSNASAAVIDFTSAATGTTGSLFSGKVTWKMTASGILNNSQLYDGKKRPTGTPLSFQTDGYGVGAKDDEITTSPKSMEWIELTFSRAVNFDAAYFLDLFRATKTADYEVGVATIDKGKSYLVNAVDYNGKREDGFAFTTFRPTKGSVIRFTVLSSNDNYGYADGALAGVGVAAIPVPAAGVLMLGGFGALAAVRRKRKPA